MKYCVLILSLLIFISCEKELDFKYHDVESQLVIEGQLNEREINVKISSTTPMNEKIEENYLTDAEVILTDINTGNKISLMADESGIYRSIYEALPGMEYSLEVKREGKIYSSKCVMREAPEILGLKFQWIKMPYDYVAVLQITFKDLENDDDCYWIRIYRNEEPYKWIMSDDRNAKDGIINEVTMTTRKNLDEEDEKDILKEGDEIKVEINAISLEMYDYLIAIQNNSNGPSMFEGGFCLGYFLAADSTSDSIIFHPEELSVFE